MSEQRPQNTHLVASHPGNEHRLVHGAFSKDRRKLAPRAAEIADELMEAGHLAACDAALVQEAGRLLALVEALDVRVLQSVYNPRHRVPESLVDLRLRASRRAQEALDRLGLSPLARSQWAANLAQGGLAADIARRRAEAVNGEARDV